MRKTIPEQIAANKRSSVVLVIVLLIVLSALGTAIIGTYQPHYWYYGTAGSLLAGIIIALVATGGGPGIVLALSHARPATHAEDTVLDNVVEEMAIAAGLPKPKIFVIDDSAPNAFATGSKPENAAIAVTTGLLRKLNRDELQGVIAHEMSHIRNYDVRFMTAVGLIAGLIPLLADMFIRMQWFGGGRRDRDRNSGDGQLAAIFMIVGIVLSILAPLFSMLLQLAVSRKREYLADASAAELTRNPEGLASALHKIAMNGEPLQAANRATQQLYIINPLKLAGGNDLFSTHPSTESRIKALLGTAGNAV
jgi:heat shock protein HtpX